ncbi:hypothetical protein NL367_27520, partial [Klebsiella pneumoniae]|nr:hypothetical protein [Klebsiella pneumoniae]
RFESSYPSHIKKARFGELFAFLRSFNVECDVDTSYPSMSDATLPRLIRLTSSVLCRSDKAITPHPAITALPDAITLRR